MLEIASAHQDTGRRLTRTGNTGSNVATVLGDYDENTALRQSRNKPWQSHTLKNREKRIPKN